MGEFEEDVGEEGGIEGEDVDALDVEELVEELDDVGVEEVEVDEDVGEDDVFGEFFVFVEEEEGEEEGGDDDCVEEVF